jgi:hypothetical protein
MTLVIKRKASIEREISRIQELGLDREDTLKAMCNLVAALLQLQKKDDSAKLRKIVDLLDGRRKS